MAIPVPIPSGALTVTVEDNVRVEDFVGKLAQLLKSGSSGVTVGSKATVVPSTIPNGTNPTELIGLELKEENQQLFYRALGFALAKSISRIPAHSNVPADKSAYPSTNDSAWSMIPEMESVLITQGGFVQITFSGTFTTFGFADFEIALWVDGNYLVGSERSMVLQENQMANISTQHVMQLPAGNHTIIAVWRVLSGEVVAFAKSRSLSVLESF